MKRKFVDNLYFVKMFKFGSKQQGYYKTGDGTLFSSNGRKTKLLEADAPEWYLFGRFYKMWGYLSTKGVMDMVYVPNMCFNHFLRDDYLLISYKDKIIHRDDVEARSRLDSYEGYERIVSGNDILNFLCGAKQYSDYDISGFIPLINAKAEWLKEKYPDDYEREAGKFVAEESLASPFYNHHPKFFYKAKMQTSSGERTYYDTKFTLDRHEGLSEITLSRRIDEEWREFSDIKMDYVSSKGTIYHVSVEEVSCQMVLLFEEGQYLRCIKPYVKNLVYTTDQDDKRILVDKEYSFSSKVLKHFNSASDNYFEATLYLPEQIMETALDVLIETDLDITCLCRELFDT